VKEIKIEDYFVEQCELRFPGCQIHKYEIRRGEPDRLVLIPGGVTAFVELKRPGKTLRNEQERARDRLRKLGFFADWANTKQEVDNVISCMEKWVEERMVRQSGSSLTSMSF
jgi:hypothetical protein